MSSAYLAQVTFVGQDKDYKEAMYSYCQELIGSKIFRQKDEAWGTIKSAEYDRRNSGNVYLQVAYDK